MSIRIDWPQNGFPEQFCEVLRSSLETAIRKAMGSRGAAQASETQQQQQQPPQENADDGVPRPSRQTATSSSSSSSSSLPTIVDQNNNNNDNAALDALMRGVVSVDALHLGTVAPTITLKRITQLTPACTGLHLHVAYAGDAWISLRGIEINLDPTMVFGGGGGADGGGRAEVVAPFFCPLTLKLKDLVLSGDVKVEVRHEIVVSDPSGEQQQQQQQHATTVPSTFFEMFSQQSSPPPAAPTPTSKASNTQQQPNKSNDHSGKKRLQRRVLIQLLDANNNNNKSSSSAAAASSTFHHPHAGGAGGAATGIGESSEFLKQFSVDSNFVPVPQAVQKIQDTLRIALKPLMQKFRKEGFTLVG